MTDIHIFLNGESMNVPKGTKLSDILQDQPKGTSVAVLKTGKVSKKMTSNIRLTTTAGDVVIRMQPGVVFPVSDTDLLRVHFEDKNSVNIGPFQSDFVPSHDAFRYDKGDVCLGCGGYDSKNSYIVFSRKEHVGKHGAAKGGAVIGKVIFGLGIINRLKNGDTISKVESVISSQDSNSALFTSDLSIELDSEDQIFSKINITAEGYTKDHSKIDTSCTESVDHMLFCLQKDELEIDMNVSTCIRDIGEGRLYVPQELQKPRREGTVTVRTKGKTSGALYIYTSDVSSSPNHTRTGFVTSGIELAKFSKKNSKLLIDIEPKLIDLRGMKLKDAVSNAKGYGLKVMADNRDVENRVVIDQKPATTLEILKEGKVSLYTIDLKDVIDITLDYENAPRSVDLFRRVTGLKRYPIGTMPFIYNVDDEMYLFKPNFAPNINIIPENNPNTMPEKDDLAITNDSRTTKGIVGVRVVQSRDFGPTGEPFGGTNIIGKVIDLDKLPLIKEGEIIYIREIKT